MTNSLTQPSCANQPRSKNTHSVCHITPIQFLSLNLGYWKNYIKREQKVLAFPVTAAKISAGLKRNYGLQIGQELVADRCKATSSQLTPVLTTSSFRTLSLRRLVLVTQCRDVPAECPSHASLWKRGFNKSCKPEAFKINTPDQTNTAVYADD